MKSRAFIQKLVGTAILTAVVLCLQLFLGSIKLGPFNITFTLIPMILGAILYGAASAAFLGLVFGIMVCFSVVSGSDAGGFILFSQKPFLTLFLVLLKSTAAGYLSGLAAGFLRKKSQLKVTKVLLPAILAPIVNTGIFIAGLLLFFQDTLKMWAMGAPIIDYLLFSILGINFVMEFTINLLLIPVILRILEGIHLTKTELEEQ